MSAYVLENEDISILVDAFLDYRVDFRSEDYRKPVQTRDLKQSIGQELLSKNIDSVNFRYSENREYSKFRYIAESERGSDYKYDPATLYRTIKCYECNTCQKPDYFKSKLHYTMSELKDAMIERYLKKDGYYVEF